MSDGGKGSKQRPTNKKKFDENFERIFGKPKEKEKKWDLMIIILNVFITIEGVSNERH